MEDDIYEAEVATPNRDAKLLNGLAAMTIAFSIGFLMMSVLFNDSVTTLVKGVEDDVGVRVEIWERANNHQKPPGPGSWETPKAHLT